MDPGEGPAGGKVCRHGNGRVGRPQFEATWAPGRFKGRVRAPGHCQQTGSFSQAAGSPSSSSGVGGQLEGRVVDVMGHLEEPGANWILAKVRAGLIGQARRAYRPVGPGVVERLRMGTNGQVRQGETTWRTRLMLATAWAVNGVPPEKATPDRMKMSIVSSPFW